MSKLKEFFEKLKLNKKASVKVDDLRPAPVDTEPTLIVFDSSGYEAEKQKALLELLEIQNGGKFGLEDVAIIEKEIVLPKQEAVAGNHETGFVALMSDASDLLNRGLHEFIVLKKYGPHHAVALHMGKNEIIENVVFQSRHPEDEFCTEIVVDGHKVNGLVSVHEVCNRRWGGQFFTYRPSEYNKFAETFSRVGDNETVRVLDYLVGSVAWNLFDAKKYSEADICNAIDMLGSQFLQDVGVYANNAQYVEERIKQNLQLKKEFVNNLFTKKERMQ